MDGYKARVATAAAAIVTPTSDDGVNQSAEMVRLCALVDELQSERRRTLVAVEKEKQAYMDDLQKCEAEMLRLKTFVDQFHQQRKQLLSTFDAEKHSYHEEIQRLHHEFKVAQEELKNHSAQQSIEWTQERSVLQQKLGTSELQISALKDELMRLNANFTEKVSHVRSCEESLQDLRGEKKHVQAQLDASREEVGRLLAELSQAGDDLKRAKDNVQEDVAALTHDLKEELDSVRAEKARLEKLLDAAKIAEEVAEGLRAKAVESQEKSANENGTIIETLHASIGRLSFQAEQAKIFKKTSEECQAQMSRFQDTLAEMRQQKDAIEDKLLRVEALHAKVSGRLEASEAKCRTLVDAHASLAAELREKDATIAELETWNDGKQEEYDKSLASLQETVANLTKDAAALKVDLDKVEMEKNTAVGEKSKLQCTLNDLHLNNEVWFSCCCPL